MKQLIIDKEKIIIKINKLKNYLYTLLYTIHKNIFIIYSGQTIFYKKGFSIAPIGNQWFTEIILFGFSIKIINRTVYY